MKKNNITKNTSLNEIFVLLLFSLMKTIILYINIKLKNITLLICTTIPPLIIVYGILNLIKNKRRNIYIIICHSLISAILFADLIYYQHYGFLPSFRFLSLLKLVPSVANSVIFMIKPINLVMIIDLIPIVIYYRKKKLKPINYSKKLKLVNKYIIVVMVILFMVNIIFANGKSTYAYSNYGIYTYHVYDIYKILTDKAEQANKEVCNTEIIIDYINKKNEKDVNKQKYYGIAKNRNIIMIQFESLQDFIINSYYDKQELTPNLNQIIKKDSIYFNNYYQQIGPGNTSDAEYAVHNSMYPTIKKSVYKTYMENKFYTLPQLLKENEYTTMIFHGNKEDFWNRKEMYLSQGIDDFISLEDFDEEEIIGLGLSDESFYKQSVMKLKQINTPFYALMITLTSHNPYKIPEEYQDIILSEEHENTLFGNYLQSINYADQALGQFFQSLKDEGLYENSLIVIYGDHSGLYSTREKNKEYMTQYLGRQYDYDESMNIPLIIHISNSQISEENTIVGSHVDLFPTILNLVGLKNEKSIMFGQDLNNIDQGFVPLQHFVPQGSFIDDEKIFIMSSDGIYENSRAWNLKTRGPIDLEKCRKAYKKAILEIKYSNYILENDLLDQISNFNRE